MTPQIHGLPVQMVVALFTLALLQFVPLPAGAQSPEEIARAGGVPQTLLDAIREYSAGNTIPPPRWVRYDAEFARGRYTYSLISQQNGLALVRWSFNGTPAPGSPVRGQTVYTLMGGVTVYSESSRAQVVGESHERRALSALEIDGPFPPKADQIVTLRWTEQVSARRGEGAWGPGELRREQLRLEAKGEVAVPGIDDGRPQRALLRSGATAGFVAYVPSMQWLVDPSRRHAVVLDLRDAGSLEASRRQSQGLSPEQRDRVRMVFSEAFRLFQQGDFSAAALRFDDGLKVDPANAAAHFYLAETYTRLEKPDLARRHYRLVIDFAPESKESSEARARLGS